MSFPNLLNMFKGIAGGSSMPTYQGTAEQNRQLAEQYNYDTGQSLVDQMNNAGLDSSFDARAKAFSAMPGQGMIGPQEPSSPMMFGQFGDPRKMMGSIFDQLKLGSQKVGQGLQGIGSALDSEYQKNLSRLGMGPVKNLENQMPPEVAQTAEPPAEPVQPPAETPIPSENNPNIVKSQFIPLEDSLNNFFGGAFNMGRSLFDRFKNYGQGRQ